MLQRLTIGERISLMLLMPTLIALVLMTLNLVQDYGRISAIGQVGADAGGVGSAAVWWFWGKIAAIAGCSPSGLQLTSQPIAPITPQPCPP